MARVQDGAASMKGILMASWKPNTSSAYDPATAHFCLDTRGLKTFVPKNICIQMFIAALIIMAQTWEARRCPPQIPPDSGVLFGANEMNYQAKKGQEENLNVYY